MDITTGSQGLAKKVFIVKCFINNGGVAGAF
jgi:hypothetical protein